MKGRNTRMPSIQNAPENRIQEHLEFLYKPEEAKQTWIKLQEIISSFRQHNSSIRTKTEGGSYKLSEGDVILITYGDQFQEEGSPPLQVLADFLRVNLKKAVNGLHILPFFPFSSDDGFSVVDYRKVDSRLGNWSHIARLNQDFRLMFDAVINHVSRESVWFKSFKHGEEPYKDFFITIDPEADLSMVVRPRARPLLTSVNTNCGVKQVWTTFSEDQIDLNYANPRVLLEILNLLLFYVEHGAEFIRLDAIAYLWKQQGTPCIHLPQTHRVVKLFRAILDAVAPGVILITETNVPHQENIRYFGDPLIDNQLGKVSPRGDEAQMVYQFPLAPLVLHTFHIGNARILTKWATKLKLPYPSATFLNFIASHDGIGVRPAEGLLSPDQIQALVTTTKLHGGEVSYKTNSDGSKSVYELNITLYDALNNPNHPKQEDDVSRFLASQFVMLSLAGVPGIYVHSLFGSRNCYQCLEETGRSRSINRQRFFRSDLESRLADPGSIESQVFTGYLDLLLQRRRRRAFHPRGNQRILNSLDTIFGLVRTAPEGNDTVICLVNVTEYPQNLGLDLDQLGLADRSIWYDLISGREYTLIDRYLRISFDSYQYIWLAPG
jgi:glycosidase